MEKVPAAGSRICIAAVSMAVAVALAVLAGCRQEPPPVEPEPDQTMIVRPPPQTMPIVPSPEPETRPAEKPAEQPRRFEVVEPSTPRPERDTPADQPLAILDKFDPLRPARLVATLESDDRMTIRTINVRALRLNLLKLPREKPGRLIVHIDGQGLEITGKVNQIIYLHRGPVGGWSFGRPE